MVVMLLMFGFENCMQVLEAIYLLGFLLTFL